MDNLSIFAVIATLLASFAAYLASHQAKRHARSAAMDAARARMHADRAHRAVAGEADENHPKPGQFPFRYGTKPEEKR